MDGSPPGSSVYGVFQARILEWVAIFFSNFKDRYDVMEFYQVLTEWDFPVL